MALTPGTRLGPYEVTARLGEGGMGVVYRARDARLNREVALKSLPDAFANDAQLLARFSREAQTLASLNHPNIAQIYGLEDDGTHRALAMELVDGPTLEEFLASHPGKRLAPDEAIPIARQIAEAVEAAHEAGIVHRDLKPANIKVRPDGTVKVLDFGLAKALGPEGTSAAGDATITSPAVTRQGTVLGTAAYMSPEQARGRPVDRRADVWAFGVVLFEMLSGERLFAGKTVSEMIAAVIKDSTRLERLPPATPPALRRLVERCLERDPKLRLRDIGEARVALSGSDIHDSATVVSAPTQRWSRSRLLFAGTAIALAAAMAYGGWLVGSRSTTTSAALPRAVDIAPNPADAFAGRSPFRRFAFTPNDGALIYSSRGDEPQLYRRDRNSHVGVAIAGTKDAYGPFVSPDGTWIGFFVDSRLMRVPLSGGAPQTVHDMGAAGAPDALAQNWSQGGFGATWLPDHTIVYARWGGGLWRVPAAGGTPAPLMNEDPPTGEISHRLPHALPGGKALLFTVVRRLNAEIDSSVEAVDLTTFKRTLLVKDATDGRYAQGRLLFARQGALYSVAFDPVTLTTTGEEKRIVDDVMHAIGGVPAAGSGVAQFDVSPDGVLAVLGGGVIPTPQQQLVILQSGRQETLTKEWAFGPRFSDDGSRVVASSSYGVKLYEVARPGLTPLASSVGYPVWRSDGSELFVATWGPQPIHTLTLAGVISPKPLLESRYLLSPSAVSRDDKWLAYIESTLKTGNDIWAVNLVSREPVPVATGPGSETHASFSVNGDWIFYANVQDGASDIYARPFPGPGPAKQLTIVGRAICPLLTFDGREIFYIVWSSDPKERRRSIVRAPVEFGPEGPHLGKEVIVDMGLFVGSSPVGGFDVSRDGKRVVAGIEVPVSTPPTPPPTLRLILRADLSGGK